MTQAMGTAESRPGTPWRRLETFAINLDCGDMDVGLSLLIAVEHTGVMTPDGPVYSLARMWQVAPLAEPVDSEWEADGDAPEDSLSFEIAFVDTLELVEGPFNSPAPTPTAAGAR